MPSWEEIMGDDDDFGEIGAELDLVAGMGTSEIVGDDDEEVGADEDLLNALSIGAARRGNHRKASALKRAATKISSFRKIDPGAVAIRQRDLNKRRRFPLGFQPRTVPNGSTSNIPAALRGVYAWRFWNVARSEAGRRVVRETHGI
jgi:hypothetical protein